MTTTTCPKVIFLYQGVWSRGSGFMVGDSPEGSMKGLTELLVPKGLGLGLAAAAPKGLLGLALLLLLLLAKGFVACLGPPKFLVLSLSCIDAPLPLPVVLGTSSSNSARALCPISSSPVSSRLSLLSSRLTCAAPSLNGRSAAWIVTFCLRLVPGLGAVDHLDCCPKAEVCAKY